MRQQRRRTQRHQACGRGSRRFASRNHNFIINAGDANAQQVAIVDDAAAGHDYVGVHSVVGESGQPMTVIKKNGVFVGAGTGARAYAATLFEVTAIARLATAMGKTYGIGAITIIHGVPARRVDVAR